MRVWDFLSGNCRKVVNVEDKVVNVNMSKELDLILISTIDYIIRI